MAPKGVLLAFELLDRLVGGGYAKAGTPKPETRNKKVRFELSSRLSEGQVGAGLTQKAISPTKTSDTWRGCFIASGCDSRQTSPPRFELGLILCLKPPVRITTPPRPRRGFPARRRGPQTLL